MSRADRRRALRAAGAHRAAGKKGRRAPIRAVARELPSSELVIGQHQKILMPTPAEIAAANDRNALERVRRG